MATLARPSYSSTLRPLEIAEALLGPEATGPGPSETDESTVFDMLFDRYLPFRLYAEFMLGKPLSVLSKEFALPEHWIAERIEAFRLCFGKQVRLRLLDTVEPSRVTH